MDRRSLGILLAFTLAITLTSCNKSSDAPVAPAASASASSTATDAASTTPSGSVSQSDRDAITKAIQQHLAENKGINMAAMDMTLQNVKISGDTAQADTEFRLKQGDTSMMMTYQLERHGGGWIVTKNQTNGAGQFAHPPMDQIHSGVAEGNPAVTSPAPGMPNVRDFLNSHPPTKSN